MITDRHGKLHFEQPQAASTLSTAEISIDSDLGIDFHDLYNLVHLGGPTLPPSEDVRPSKAPSFEDDPLAGLGDLGLDLDLDSLFEGNNTDDGLGKILDTFTKEFGQGEEVSHAVFYTLVIVYGVVITLGLVGNIVILYAILSKKGMRTARNYFILCLAFSDLLLCAFTMPLTLWEVLRKVCCQISNATTTIILPFAEKGILPTFSWGWMYLLSKSRKWVFGKDLQWLCQLAHSCQGTPVFLSSMAIVAIAVDRYRCIMQPERPHFSAGVALLIALIMGVSSILLSLPMYLSAEVKTFIEFPDATNMEDILICQDTWDGSGKFVYTVVASIAQFFVPVILVIILYLSIYLKLKNRPQSQHAENNEKRRRTNIMILSISVVFFVSWLPLNVFNFLMDMYPDSMKNLIAGNETVIYAVLHLFGMCNALTNPILYGYLNENFRKEYRNIYRQMPWYSHTTNEAGMELAVHYHVVNGQVKTASRTAAILAIDHDNVNVIGPACIAQRLMFAAMAAANANPPLTPDDSSDSAPNESKPSRQRDYNWSDSSEEDTEEESPTAEAVAKAFLESVDKYMEYDETVRSQEFSPKNGGVSGVLYVGQNGNYHCQRHTSHESDNSVFKQDEETDDENFQVVFVAPRLRRSSTKSSNRKSSKRYKKGGVRLLSIDSFSRNNSVDVKESTTEPVQRLLSIPDVLLNAASESQSAPPPRTRVISMFAQKEQMRPVYAPNSKHPIDLEGLQETAV